MKKSLFIILTLCLLAFVSCSDPIFYNISQEVALSDPTVTGMIVNVAQFDGKLFCANGNIFSKDTARWVKQPKIAKAGNIVNVASDSNWLYAYEDNGNVWAKSTTTEWTKVDSDVEMLFDNGSTTNRAAFYKKSNEIYKLNGTSSNKQAIAAANIVDGTEAKNIKACVNVAGTDYFSTTPAIATKGNLIYFAAASSVKYADVSDITTVKNAGSASSGITALCLVNSVLYIGTEGGLKTATINADNTFTKPNDVPIDNTTSIFGSRKIEGIWFINNKTYVCSGSISSSDYHFLWSYNETTKKWNKE